MSEENKQEEAQQEAPQPIQIDPRFDVGELVARITSEMAKLPEFMKELGAGAAEELIKSQMTKTHITNNAIDQYVAILKERLSKFEHGPELAEIIMNIIHIAMATSSASRYENLKKVEQSKPNKDIVSIANCDQFSRGSKEIRASNMHALNSRLRQLYGEEYRFIPRVRTF